MYKRIGNTIIKGIFLVALLMFAGANFAFAQGDSVVDVVNESDDHQVFSELLVESGLAETLAQQGPYTVMAPTDEAFEELGPELEQMRQNPQQLQNVVINHLFQGEVSAEEIEPVIGVEVEDGDVGATNGVVHTIAEVILER